MTAVKILATLLCPGHCRLARPSQQLASSLATPTSRRRRTAATPRETRSTRRWNRSLAASQPPFSDGPSRSCLRRVAWYVCSQGRTSSETDKSDPPFANRRRIRISPSLLAALGGSTPKSNVVSFSTVRSACIARDGKLDTIKGMSSRRSPKFLCLSPPSHRKHRWSVTAARPTFRPRGRKWSPVRRLGRRSIRYIDVLDPCCQTGGIQ